MFRNKMVHRSINASELATLVRDDDNSDHSCSDYSIELSNNGYNEALTMKAERSMTVTLPNALYLYVTSCCAICLFT